jgi:O-antigen ligase
MKFTLFGYPLYLIEVPTILALIALLIGKRTAPKHIDSYIISGIILFVSGTIISFFSNPFSLTGLGLLKTWIFFPLITTWLIARFADADDIRKYFLLGMTASSGAIALGACFFLIHSQLTYDGRLQAWYTSPNFLALAITPGIMTTLAILISSKMRSKIVAPISIAILILMMITLFFTRSYGTWIATAAALIIFFTIPHRFSKNWPAIRISIITIFALFSCFIFLEHSSEKWSALISFNDRSSFSSRLMIWRAAQTMLAEHPIIGIGIGRFQETYLALQPFFPPYLEWAVPQPHNLYLALWLQAGLLGIIGFCIIIFRIFMLLIRSLSTSPSMVETKTALISIITLFLIYGMTDTPLFGNALAFEFWVIIGAALAITTQKGSDVTSDPASSLSKS